MPHCSFEDVCSSSVVVDVPYFLIVGGIPTKDIGPINEWWVAGFDGGEKALVGFSTGFGEYYLMEPSEPYAPFMKKINEKICISKTVIEFLLEDKSATYEDLLNRLQVWEHPFTEGGLFSL